MASSRAEQAVPLLLDAQGMPVLDGLLAQFRLCCLSSDPLPGVSVYRSLLAAVLNWYAV